MYLKSTSEAQTLIINLFVLYRGGNLKVLILSIFKKISFLIKLTLMLSLVYFSMLNFGDRNNFMSV
jgi:hypothetical protein